MLSRKDFAEKDWSTKGLLESPPAYYLREYDSGACIPSAIEQMIYVARVSCGILNDLNDELLLVISLTNIVWWRFQQ